MTFFSVSSLHFLASEPASMRAGPSSWVCFLPESLSFPLFLATFSVCCLPVPFLFELPPQFLYSLFWSHPAPRKVRSRSGPQASWPKGCGAWLPAWTPPSVHGALGPSPSLCLSSGASPNHALGLCPSVSLCPGPKCPFFPVDSPCLCPWEDAPGSVASLCPLPSLQLASRSGSLGFCSLDSGTSVLSPYVGSFPCVSYLPWEYPTVQPKGVF